MAFKLEYNSVSKVTGDYWKITNFSWNTIQNVVLLSLSLYKDKASRDNLELPIHEFKILLSENEHNLSLDYTKNTQNMNIFEYFYQLIKLLPVRDNILDKIVDFKKAEDI